MRKNRINNASRNYTAELLAHTQCLKHTSRIKGSYECALPPYTHSHFLHKRGTFLVDTNKVSETNYLRVVGVKKASGEADQKCVIMAA